MGVWPTRIYLCIGEPGELHTPIVLEMLKNLNCAHSASCQHLVCSMVLNVYHSFLAVLWVHHRNCICFATGMDALVKAGCIIPCLQISFVRVCFCLENPHVKFRFYTILSVMSVTPLQREMSICWDFNWFRQWRQALTQCGLWRPQECRMQLSGIFDQIFQRQK